MSSNAESCQKQPCKSCPFRKDTTFLVGTLSKRRRQEIIDLHIHGDFYFNCHSNNSKLCAGIIMLADKIDKNANVTTRLGRMAGIIPKQFKNMDKVIDTAEEFLKHKEI